MRYVGLQSIRVVWFNVMFDHLLQYFTNTEVMVVDFLILSGYELPKNVEFKFKALAIQLNTKHAWHVLEHSKNLQVLEVGEFRGYRDLDEICKLVEFKSLRSLRIIGNPWRWHDIPTYRWLKYLRCKNVLR